MSPYAIGQIIGRLIGTLALLTPFLLFFRTQYRTLVSIRLENRRMNPGLVWLQLIPLFNHIFVFFVVKWIADSLAKEFAGWEGDSIFGIADEEVIKKMGKRPTYVIGLAYCILFGCTLLTVIFMNLFYDLNSTSRTYIAIVGLILILLPLATLTCWIIYWVQLTQYRNKLERVLAELV